MNTSSYATNIVHRIYPPFWMRFCKVTDIDVRAYAVFKDSAMIGLSIPVGKDAVEEFDKKFFSLERVSTTSDPVLHYVVKHGSFFYDVYFFESNVSIEVNSATNPKLI